MEFRVLGSLEVDEASRSIPLGGEKQRALLALLVLNANHVVSRDRLIDELWGEEPPVRAVATVQVYVSRLRRLLGAELLVTRPPGYMLLTEPEAIDLCRFEQLLSEAREIEAPAARELLRQALALWRGPPLAEFDESFARIERGRLEEARLAALEQQVDADLACGNHAELVGGLRGLIAEHPHREGLRGQMMLALYRSGRQAEALEEYRAARAALAEIGIEPGDRLRELERAILIQDPSLRLSAPPPPTNVPLHGTPLIGRESELADVTALLRHQDVRLLTITGAGGVGKTRLALSAAAALAHEFPDGVWFVSLAAITDPAGVGSTVAQVLGVEDAPLFLRSRHLLLVLDNFEQVLAAAPAVANLLSGSPDLRVLATSRERLQLALEHEYVLVGLPPEDGVALFAERARRLQPRFEPDEHVERIVSRVDGLPLALELAAVHVKVLSSEQIYGYLDRGFDSLAEGPRDAPPRHRTIRATLDWSHHLLTRRERRAFARLGVFAGGFDLSAAQEVADVEVDVLGSLVNKSLVARAPKARFFMLDLILQFAREHFDQLPDREDLRRRHAEYYIGLPTRGSPTTTDMAARELENYRAAAEWARSRNEFELLVAAADAGFQMRVPVAEAASWLDAALPHLAELDAAVGLRALMRYSAICWILDDFARARSLAEEALDGACKIHDEAAEMKSLRMLGDSLCLLGEYDKARRALRRSLALAEQQHDFVAHALVLRDSGENERRAGHLDRARYFLESALRLTRDDERARPLRPTVLHALGDTERLGAQYALAQRHYVAALLESQRIGEDRYAISHLYGLAAVAVAEGDPRRAVVLWGGAKAHEEAIGRRLPRFEREEYEEALSAVAADASAAAARSAQTLNFEEVIQYALEGATPTS